MSPFPCKKNTLITVCVYVCSAHSVLHVRMTRKRAAYAQWRIVQMFEYRQHSEDDCLRLFHTRKRAAYMGLRHASMNASAGLRHAYATFTLLSRLFLCSIKPAKIISSRSCHCALWAALRSQGRCPSMLPGSGKFCKKPRRIPHITAVSVAYLRVLAYLFGREI